jgi:hypothetical protein
VNLPVFNPREVNLDRLNSITKYPSIPTYHELDPKNGRLLDSAVLFEGEVIATEKIDGTNARAILCPNGDYILGSREQLLYAKGDLIGDPSQGIVDALWEWAEGLDFLHLLTSPLVIYLEVFGGNIGKSAKNYSSYRATDFRIFDIAEFPADQLYEMMEWPPAKISGWRESNHQNWDTEDQLVGRVAGGKLGALAPRILRLDGNEIPRTIEDMGLWLAMQLPVTNVAMDDKAALVAEGIVLRSVDRKTIAKARFEDYRRTLRKNN